MRWIILIFIIVLLLGPLRRWVGRHWAFLLSVFIGGISGLLFGSWLAVKTVGSVPGLPLMFALIGIAIAVQAGPSALRKIERDGKK